MTLSWAFGKGSLLLGFGLFLLRLLLLVVQGLELAFHGRLLLEEILDLGLGFLIGNHLDRLLELLAGNSDPLPFRAPIREGPVHIPERFRDCSRRLASFLPWLKHGFR